MESRIINEINTELHKSCIPIRELIEDRAYSKCENLILEVMSKHPHAPQPHNLLGILLEQTGDHLMAMKHFRVAEALDPTYIPARHNLDYFGTFSLGGTYAFDESDIPTNKHHKINAR